MKTAKKIVEKADEKTQDAFAKCVRKLRRGRPLKKRKTLPLFEEMVASLSIVGKSFAGGSTRDCTLREYNTTWSISRTYRVANLVVLCRRIPPSSGQLQ